MKEIWADIPGKEGEYQVSNLGNVRSCVKRAEWYMLSPYQDTCRYMYVDIDKRNRAIHRLVAEAFLPAEAGKKEINHKDGDKHNNRVDNLEWCNRSENVKHAYESGLKANPLRGDSWKARRVLCVDTGKEYSCMMDAEDDTGARQANISKCCRGLRNTAGGYRWRYADGGDANVVTV